MDEIGSTVPMGDLEWVCCLARGAQGADPVPVPNGAKSPPRKDSKMQRKRTGPGAPRAGPSPRKREPVDA